jgi:hypothetical protein
MIVFCRCLFFSLFSFSLFVFLLGAFCFCLIVNAELALARQKQGLMDEALKAYRKVCILVCVLLVFEFVLQV